MVAKVDFSVEVVSKLCEAFQAPSRAAVYYHGRKLVLVGGSGMTKEKAAKKGFTKVSAGWLLRHLQKVEREKKLLTEQKEKLPGILRRLEKGSEKREKKWNWIWKVFVRLGNLFTVCEFALTSELAKKLGKRVEEQRLPNRFLEGKPSLESPSPSVDSDIPRSLQETPPLQPSELSSSQTPPVLQTPKVSTPLSSTPSDSTDGIPRKVRDSYKELTDYLEKNPHLRLRGLASFSPKKNKEKLKKMQQSPTRKVKQAVVSVEGTDSVARALSLKNSEQTPFLLVSHASWKNESGKRLLGGSSWVDKGLSAADKSVFLRTNASSRPLDKSVDTLNSWFFKTSCLQVVKDENDSFVEDKPAELSGIFFKVYTSKKRIRKVLARVRELGGKSVVPVYLGPQESQEKFERLVSKVLQEERFKGLFTPWKAVSDEGVGCKGLPLPKEEE